jgi:hypothetical protein
MTEQTITTWRIQFSLYTWCPRNPYGESTLEQHRNQMLYHHWFEGHACCTAVEALPPDVLEKARKVYS